MNTFNINDENFKTSRLYQDFMASHPKQGYLKIRAYAASQAIPIRGLKIVVSSMIENNKVIFFEGYTNDSGVIEKINLPASTLDPNNLDVPNKTIYEIEATYSPNQITQIYKINIYENICVIQNINIVPNQVGRF